MSTALVSKRAKSMFGANSASAMTSLTSLNPFQNWNRDKTIQTGLGVASLACAALAFFKPKVQTGATVAGVVFLGGSWFYPEIRDYAVEKYDAYEQKKNA